MNKLVFSLLLAILLVPTPSVAQTATVTVARDTDQQSDNPAGTNPLIHASRWNQSLLEFDLEQRPPEDAQLTLRVWKVGDAPAFRLSVHPARNGKASGSKGSVPAGPSGWMLIALGQAKEWLPAQGRTIALALSAGTDGWQAFSSREGEHPSQLMVSVAAVAGAVALSAAPNEAPLPQPPMTLGTNFWFLAPWSGEQPFRTGVDFAQASARSESPWNPRFVAQLAPYTTLRFMDWGATNNSRVERWAQRRLPADPKNNDIGYVGPGDPLQPGLAYEWMIDLANRTGKDPWICLPHAADADYARQLAVLLRDRLAPGRKVYIEYSNETWNGSFTQFQYTLDEAKRLGLPGENQWYAGGAYSVYRSLELFRTFDEVFGASRATRVVRVVSYMGNADIFDQGYGAVVTSPRWNPSGQKADLIAIAPYLGSELDGKSPQIEQEWDDAIADMVDRYIRPAAGFARKYRTQLGCYEGGQHLLKNADVWSADPRIEAAYRRMLDAWAPWFTLFNHYSHTGVWANNGAWGALASTDQDLDRAPKYRALRDWAMQKVGSVTK